MTEDRLTEIRDVVDLAEENAERILRGDSDNYDGADGARKVKQLCRYCYELIAEYTLAVSALNK